MAPIAPDELTRTRRFYDRMSRAYDLLSDASEQAARDKGLELLAVAPGEHVLEIGYGTGHALVALARAVGPGGRVVGIDVSSGMRDVALHRLEQESLAERVELLVEAVPPIPAADAAFDAAFLSFTLELFPDGTIPELLADLRRILRPQGRLGVVCLAEHDPGEPESLIERAYRFMHDHFPHIVDCRPIRIDRHLTKADFTPLARYDTEIWTLPVRAVVADRG